MEIAFISLIILLLSPPSLGRSLPNPNCHNRWIHIRSLPPQFNTDLLKPCKSFPLFSPDFCPSLSNHGLGPFTHNLTHPWHRTDSRFLEPFFHRRLLEYPCLTPNPLVATAIFLPYYASLAALPFLYSPSHYNNSPLHGQSLHRFLTSHNPRIWARRSSLDHFLLLSRPSWDFSQHPAADPPSWGTSFLQNPSFLNLTILTVESRPSPWQEQAIPYLTSFHPSNLEQLDSWIEKCRNAERPTLMLFAGGGGGGGANIRGSIRAECANETTEVCEIVDSAEDVGAMLRARFCLQPPGDTVTRRGIFDGMIAGCVPVFFEEGARRMYGWHLGGEGEYSVLVGKEEVVYGGVKVGEVLGGIGEEEVRRMRERVLEIAGRVVYRREGSERGLRERKDAFDLAVEGVLRRVRRRSKAVGREEVLLFDDDDEMDGLDS